MLAASGRIPQLDLLRGIAVLAVIICHYPYIKAFRFGAVGVDLFFVLSGFLISGLLFSSWKRDGTIKLSNFFIRRGFKIYPSFYFFLLTASGAFVLGNPTIWAHPLRFSASELFFLQDYLPRIWPHTWSLAVEEQFYILLPLSLLLIARFHNPKRPFAAILPLSALIFILCLALRIHRHPSSPDDVYFALHFRADSLFAGVALGYLYAFRRDAFYRISHPAVLPIAILLLIPRYIWMDRAEMSPYAIGCATLAFTGIVLWAVTRCHFRMPRVEWVGSRSYSIYLWHAPLAIIFRASFGGEMWAFLPYVAGSIALGGYFSEIIEFRALKLRDRWFPANSGTGNPIIAPALLAKSSGLDCHPNTA